MASSQQAAGRIEGLMASPRLARIAETILVLLPAENFPEPEMRVYPRAEIGNELQQQHRDREHQQPERLPGREPHLAEQPVQRPRLDRPDVEQRQPERDQQRIESQQGESQGFAHRFCVPLPAFRVRGMLAGFLLRRKIYRYFSVWRSYRWAGRLRGVVIGVPVLLGRFF